MLKLLKRTQGTVISVSIRKIGKEVLFLPVSDVNPRNGEGSLIVLKNGDVLYVFTEYAGSGRADHSNARLSACISKDGGESWSAPVPMMEKDEDATNIMSVSLIRLANGDLGMVYLRKDTDADGGISCMPCFVSSSDEGKSWSKPTVCTAERAYYCVINDGVIVGKSGRVIVPMSYNKGLYYPGRGFDEKRGASVRFAVSDDNGKSWRDLPGEITSPYEDLTGLCEPGVYEHKDGELWMYCRTAYGFQYQSHSKDGGVTWTTPKPNLFFTSPDAPMRVKRVGELTVAVFNPVPHNYFSHTREDWGAPKRTPLALAVSRDDGRSFQLPVGGSVNSDLRGMADMLRLIEDERSISYCYPAITAVSDGLLVAYYHSGGTGHCLTNNKITKIYFDEI